MRKYFNIRWYQIEALPGYFVSRRDRAIKAYKTFVPEGKDQPSPPGVHWRTRCFQAMMILLKTCKVSCRIVSRHGEFPGCSCRLWSDHWHGIHGSSNNGTRSLSWLTRVDIIPRTKLADASALVIRPRAEWWGKLMCKWRPVPIRQENYPELFN